METPGCDYTLTMRNMQPAGRPHHNQGLFSDHYLNVKRCPRRPAMESLAGGARPVMEEIAGLLDSYVPELDRYIRVITSADREKLINAFKDRNFTRRHKWEGS